MSGRERSVIPAGGLCGCSQPGGATSDYRGRAASILGPSPRLRRREQPRHRGREIVHGVEFGHRAEGGRPARPSDADLRTLRSRPSLPPPRTGFSPKKWTISMPGRGTFAVAGPPRRCRRGPRNREPPGPDGSVEAQAELQERQYVSCYDIVSINIQVIVEISLGTRQPIRCESNRPQKSAQQARFGPEDGWFCSGRYGRWTLNPARSRRMAVL